MSDVVFGGVRPVISVLSLLAMATEKHVPKPDPKLPNSAWVGTTFSGGDWDGLSIGWKVDAKGSTYVGLLPSKKNASPPPPEIARIVDGLITAYLKRDLKMYDQFVSLGAFSAFDSPYCESGEPFSEVEFHLQGKGEFVPNTPFLYKGPYERGRTIVRVEWLDDAQLAYTSSVQIANGLVQSVCTDSERLPPLPAFNKPKPSG